MATQPGQCHSTLRQLSRYKATPEEHEDLRKNWSNESYSPCEIPGVTSCKCDSVTRELGANPRKQKQNNYSRTCTPAFDPQRQKHSPAFTGQP